MILIRTELICWLSNARSNFNFENAVFDGSNLNPTLSANSSSLVIAPISVMIICFSGIGVVVLLDFYGSIK